MFLARHLYLLIAHVFAENLYVGLVLVDDLVDLAPVGQSGDASVIDEIVGLDLTAEMIVLFYLFFGVVAVDGPEVDASLMTPVHGCLQGFTLAPYKQQLI